MYGICHKVFFVNLIFYETYRSAGHYLSFNNKKSFFFDLIEMNLIYYINSINCLLFKEERRRLAISLVLNYCYIILWGSFGWALLVLNHWWLQMLEDTSIWFRILWCWVDSIQSLRIDFKKSRHFKFSSSCCSFSMIFVHLILALINLRNMNYYLFSFFKQFFILFPPFLLFYFSFFLTKFLLFFKLVRILHFNFVLITNLLC